MSKFTKRRKRKDRVRRHWTPTCLKTGEACLRRYYDVYEAKEPQPTSAALEKGNYVHGLMEKYLLGGDALNVYKRWLGELDTLRRIEAIPEQLWSIDRNWNPLPKQAPRSELWARLKTDAHHIDKGGKSALVVDFKTGGIYDEHDDLMELYALALAKYAPQAETVRAALWYLDQNEVKERTYDRSELEALYPAWTRRADRVLAAETFTPTPSKDACRFCRLGKGKHGNRTCPVAYDT